ncbi:hypothetical protein QAD02_002831 [Eretmocerus hayati]|uniref:Uncharacterized protein n=1 Tax=Eretmocerus hayati TaxID=131215 RepID=A0ACC2NKD8_9HYME|nr:hypothetical protein QAD02_002831 [Eretmocerus hayati]
MSNIDSDSEKEGEVETKIPSQINSETDKIVESDSQVEKKDEQTRNNPRSSSESHITSPNNCKRRSSSEDSSSDEVKPKKKKQSPLIISDTEDKSLPSVKISLYKIPEYIGRLSFELKIKSKGDIVASRYPRGKYFEMEVLDEFNITKAKVYNDDCKELYSMLEVGKVYIISKVRLVAVHPSFGKKMYEFHFDDKTEIKGIEGSKLDNIHDHYNFHDVAGIAVTEANTIIDFIGVVKSFEEEIKLPKNKNGKINKLRNVTFLDENDKKITVVFWNDKIESVTEKMKGRTLVLHNVKINLYEDEKKLFFNADSRIDEPANNKRFMELEKMEWQRQNSKKRTLCYDFEQMDIENIKKKPRFSSESSELYDVKNVKGQEYRCEVEDQYMSHIEYNQKLLNYLISLDQMDVEKELFPNLTHETNFTELGQVQYNCEREFSVRVNKGSEKADLRLVIHRQQQVRYNKKKVEQQYEKEDMNEFELQRLRQTLEYCLKIV